MMLPALEISPLLAAAVLLSTVAGAIAHELTHAFVAALLGSRAHVDLFALNVYYEREGLSQARERVILLAPAALGWTLGAVWYALYGAPAWDLWTIPPVATWAVYVLMAGPSDYSLRIARGDGWFWSELSIQERRTAGAVLFGLPTLAVWHYWPAQIPSMELFYVVQAVLQGLYFSALILALWAMVPPDHGTFDPLVDELTERKARLVGSLISGVESE